MLNVQPLRLSRLEDAEVVGRKCRLALLQLSECRKIVIEIPSRCNSVIIPSDRLRTKAVIVVVY